MLKAFLMRGKLDADTENIRDLVKEEEANVDKDFNAELKSAVELCNEETLSADEKKYCDRIKKQLHQ